MVDKLSRKEKRALADKKRRAIEVQILDYLKTSMDSPGATVVSSLEETDAQIQRMIRQHPKVAHLIRQAAYNVNRDIESALKKDQTANP